MTAHHTIRYGGQCFGYSLQRRDRKTLEISVLPDMSIEVVAPLTASHDEIEKRISRRAGWIRKQIQYFEQFHPRTSPRKFVAGETHLYLGRRYRLKIKQSAQQKIVLKRGFLEVHTHRPSRVDLIQAQLEAWYKTRAVERLKSQVENALDRFAAPEQVRPQSVIVRQLSRRWGSMSSEGRLILNRRLIQAAPHEIDYVITHELCHRRFHHHGPEFYRLLSRLMPDWEKRKASLERRLI